MKSIYILTILFSINSLALAANINAGKEKSSVCVACHGNKGISGNKQWPNLAGQQSLYITKQLKDFRSGQRKSSIMQGMAASLSDTDINNLAAYFSSLKPMFATSDNNLAKAGKSKAAMCLGCHKKNAQGNGQFPRLAGQNAEYLVTQLNNFKSAARKNVQMKAMSANLTENDIKALAAYFASITP